MEDEEPDAEDMPLSDDEGAEAVSSEEDDEVADIYGGAEPAAAAVQRGQQRRTRSPEAYAMTPAQRSVRQQATAAAYKGPHQASKSHPLHLRTTQQRPPPPGWAAVASEDLFGTFWSLSMHDLHPELPPQHDKQQQRRRARVSKRQRLMQEYLTGAKGSWIVGAGGLEAQAVSTQYSSGLRFVLMQLPLAPGSLQAKIFAPLWPV